MYETGRDRIGPSSMFGRLMTSRPIRIEDGRDIRGRRGRQQREARRSAAVARSPAPRGPYFLRQDNKGYYNATRLPRILHTCHYKGLLEALRLCGGWLHAAEGWVRTCSRPVTRRTRPCVDAGWLPAKSPEEELPPAGVREETRFVSLAYQLTPSASSRLLHSPSLHDSLRGRHQDPSSQVVQIREQGRGQNQETHPLLPLRPAQQHWPWSLQPPPRGSQCEVQREGQGLGAFGAAAASELCEPG
ncbi:hypothetical protein NDU88_001032 [Pleurodeles waltl]|uniref:Uncharacterized protein n=1 Tax=Pleurodeles waltl TaxID=8319 RepID=A0AAV7VXW1_PLEWA|nr:hypothetical protein NDU88_001032 [Pleurodeles waltl]